MANNKDMYIELANRIYDLDGEVYKCVGSSLGRTFTGSRENTIRALSMLMYTKPDGHLLRSELALISNMARTIKNKEDKSRMMTEYNEILKAMEQLPEMSATDIVNAERNGSEYRLHTWMKWTKMRISLSVSAVHREVREMILDLSWQISCISIIMIQDFEQVLNVRKKKISY